MAKITFNRFVYSVPVKLPVNALDPKHALISELTYELRHPLHDMQEFFPVPRTVEVPTLSEDFSSAAFVVRVSEDFKKVSFVVVSDHGAEHALFNSDSEELIPHDPLNHSAKNLIAYQKVLKSTDNSNILEISEKTRKSSHDLISNCLKSAFDKNFPGFLGEFRYDVHGIKYDEARTLASVLRAALAIRLALDQ